MTEEELQGREAICAAATPGPWTHLNHRSEPTGRVYRMILERTGRLFASLVCQMSEGPGDHEADAAFVAHVRVGYPEALAEIRRLRSALEEIVDTPELTSDGAIRIAKRALREEVSS